MTNYNPETGIAYGVVSMNSLADWAFEEFVADGTNLSAEAAYADWSEGLSADEIANGADDFWNEYRVDEENWVLEKDGLKLGLSWLGGAPLVWVFESPHTTTATPCSPCVPGAGDLDTPSDDGIRCYTLPTEWFEVA